MSQKLLDTYKKSLERLQRDYAVVQQMSKLDIPDVSQDALDRMTNAALSALRTSNDTTLPPAKKQRRTSPLRHGDSTDSSDGDDSDYNSAYKQESSVQTEDVSGDTVSESLPCTLVDSAVAHPSGRPKRKAARRSWVSTWNGLDSDAKTANTCVHCRKHYRRLDMHVPYCPANPKRVPRTDNR